MYNNATRCWSLQDAGGSYSWIVENYDSKDFQTMTDDEIHAWADQLIDQERDESARQIESWAENKHYPCFGYTTATILENADEYIAYFKADFESDMVGEREYVFDWIKTWIKGKGNKMTTSMTASSSVRWQDFFREEPCQRGFSRFAEAVEKHGLHAAVKRAPLSDRMWGAEYTYRADILLILAQDADTGVRCCVAQNVHTSAETLSALAQDAVVSVRRCVALNAHTPAEVLATLAQDAVVYVRRNVAQNVHTSAETLNALAQDANVDVRRYVAKSAHTPAEVLATLAQDTDVYVRYRVAQNAHTPVETLSALAQDAVAYIRSMAQARLQSIEPSLDH